MNQIHKQEKAQFEKLFKQENIDRFEDRFKILEVFLQTERHITIDDLIRILKANGHYFELEFVNNTLKLMCRFGFARQNRFDNGNVNYEHLHLGQHHDHMICTKCRKIVEFEDPALEALQLKIAADHGFHMLQHKMEMYGLCAGCLEKRTRLLPLATAKAGERFIIKGFAGGPKGRMRLLTMGLRFGDEIEVITNYSNGQIIVAADCQRYVLGRKMAKKLLVKPI
jgi:Fur family ferric uptake transcriptional regulator